MISSSQSALRVPRKQIAALIAFLDSFEDVRIAEVDLAVVSGREMAALNRRYRGRARQTDVLSFDLTEEGDKALVAQLVVCGDVAVREAKLRGLGPQRELMLYVVHGLLHLVGYDDRSSTDAARMRARQEEILDAFVRPAKM